MVKFILNLVLRGNLQLLWHNAASARRCPSVGVGFFCVCTSRPFRYALVRAKSQNPAVDTRMSASDPFRSQPSSNAQQFATTHWSVVLTAGESGSQQAAMNRASKRRGGGECTGQLVSHPPSRPIA